MLSIIKVRVIFRKAHRRPLHKEQPYKLLQKKEESLEAVIPVTLLLEYQTEIHSLLVTSICCV